MVTICMGHARLYQKEQPELAIRHLLYHVDTVILCLEGQWGVKTSLNHSSYLRVRV